MRKPDAVIFDMDGVLVDSEPIHIQIEQEIFGQLGIVVAGAIHRSYMGASSDFMYGDLKTRFGLKDSVEELMANDESFRSNYFKKLEVVQPNDGVISLLNELKSAGLKLAVATSSSPKMAKLILNRCGIEPFFDTIVTTSEAGASKPLPDVYLLAAKKIGISPASCIVFEDSPNGLSAAKSAGMFCIAMQSDAAFDLSKADYVIQTFKAFNLDRLLKIFNSKHLTQE